MSRKGIYDLEKLYEAIKEAKELFCYYLAYSLMIGLDKGFRTSVFEGSLTQIVHASDMKQEMLHTILKSDKLSQSQKNTFIDVTERVFESGIPVREVIFNFNLLSLKDEEFDSFTKEFFVLSEKKLNLEEMTPKCVNDLMILLLNPQDGSFYDGMMGLGNTLLTAHHYAPSLQLYGQEIQKDLYNLAVLKYYVLGIDSVHLAYGHALKDPQFINENHQLMQFDYAAMNFPFGLRNEDDDLMKQDVYGRLEYGKPSRVGMDYFIFSHLMLSLNQTGKAAVVVPNGTLFRTNSDAKIRAKLVSSDLIEAVITLPEQLFSHTAIQTNLIIFNKNKDNPRKHHILFMNAEHLYEVKGRRQRIMTEKHLHQIQQIFETYTEQDEFSKIVKNSDLKDYNLLPSEYVVQRGMQIDGYGEVKFDLPKIMEASYGQTISLLGRIYRGVSVMGRHEPVADGEYSVINLADVQDGEIQVSKLARYNFSANTRTENYLVEEGDLIVSSRGAQIKLAIVPKHEGKMLLSQNFIGIRLQYGVDANYLKAYLESPVGQYLLAQKLTGSAVLTLTPRQLMEIPVIFPEREAQVQMMTEYEKRKAELEAQIQQLDVQKKQNQLELFEKMGLSHLMTFE